MAGGFHFGGLADIQDERRFGGKRFIQLGARDGVEALIGSLERNYLRGRGGLRN
jgi:hypothetical protein